MNKWTENELYTKHLQGMVQIPTISTENDASTDWQPFTQFREYLAATYPLVHQNLELTIIGHASLLFHWQVKEKKHLPILLMAHQDVVEVGDSSLWTFPPFSGQLHDGALWGRGSIDCKSPLLYEIEAIEALLEEHFEPNFDVYLFFGHNEEISADAKHKGAALAVAYLKQRGVTLGCVFDEGGAVRCGAEAGLDKDVANINLGEKASTSFLLTKLDKGGHACRPGRTSAAASLARAILALEEKPYPCRLTELTIQEFKAQAAIQPASRQEIYDDPQNHLPELAELAASNRDLDAKLRTTWVTTMLQASKQDNVLPTRAEAVVNVRLLQGDTLSSVQEYLSSIMPEDVTVSIRGGQNPKPVGSVNSPEYHLLKQVVQQLYDQQVIVVPGLLTGGTDSRFFSDICSNVFRFSGGYRTNKYGETHQIDEHIPVAILPAGVEFFKAFLKAYKYL